ncbi:hypothetical protein [Leptospira alstonii]|uniref:hypothetical protein n=1 Tax=Leptospira alstonii TaxID=28452 RepID=UPI0012DCFC32|nr:hypothetical protein [Leptospira alstonii]
MSEMLAQEFLAGNMASNMKFFTKKWASGELSDEEAQEVPELYQKHLDGIIPELAFSVRALALGISLHDGLVQKFQKRGHNLEIVIIVGDLQVGYQTLKLTYISGKLLASKAMHEKLKKKNAVEIIYDEIDIGAKAGFIHRILTSSRRHFEIQFTDLRISLKPRKNGRK